MEPHEIEAIVAAILTAGQGGEPAKVKDMVIRYRRMVDELRATGGAVQPA